MKLINPRGKVVEFSKEKGEKILSMKVKKRQGWKLFKEKPAKDVEVSKPKATNEKKKPGRKPKVNGQSNK